MHAGCIGNIMSPYVNVQYWEIQESIILVHRFSGRRLKLPSCMFIVHVYKGLLLLP